MQGLLVAAIVLTSVAVLLFAAAFVSLAAMAGRIGRLSEETAKLVKDARAEIVPAAAEARSALANIDKLTGRAVETVERIDRVAGKAENLLDGAYVADVAGKIAQSSASGLVSVYEGLKQGIRTLRGSQKAAKGGSSDE